MDERMACLYHQPSSSSIVITRLQPAHKVMHSFFRRIFIEFFFCGFVQCCSRIQYAIVISIFSLPSLVIKRLFFSRKENASSEDNLTGTVTYKFKIINSHRPDGNQHGFFSLVIFITDIICDNPGELCFHPQGNKRAGNINFIRQHFIITKMLMSKLQVKIMSAIISYCVHRAGFYCKALTTFLQ
jgi:hypothetical protein